VHGDPAQVASGEEVDLAGVDAGTDLNAGRVYSLLR
jgi:hypothetical protein